MNNNRYIVKNKNEGSEKKMDKEIKGISCEVKNCIYHDMSNRCTAGEIKVGTKSATKTSETNCQTFECCDDCGCGCK